MHFICKNLRDYWKDYIKNPTSQIAIPRPGCNMTDQEIQELCHKAYMEFYYRPSYVLRALEGEIFEELCAHLRSHLK